MGNSQPVTPVAPVAPVAPTSADVASPPFESTKSPIDSNSSHVVKTSKPSHLQNTLDLLEGNRSAKGKEFSSCMLSPEASLFTYGGIILGLAVGYWKRNLKPLIFIAGTGTFFDTFYASQYACKQQLSEFETAKKAYDAEVERLKKSSDS